MGLLRWGQIQLEVEVRACGGARVEGEFAAHRRDEAARDREAQARRGEGVALLAARAAERLEQGLARLRIDPAPSIAHREGYAAPVGVGGLDRDGALVREFPGVGREVQEPAV